MRGCGWELAPCSTPIPAFWEEGLSWKLVSMASTPRGQAGAALLTF